MYSGLASVWLLATVLPSTTGIVERSTGFDFPTGSPKLGKLHSLGVRKKGPIKVYAVGMYEDMFKSKGFMLKMAMGVSAQKMTNVQDGVAVLPRELTRRAQALVDAVKPRLKSGDQSSLEKFSALLLRGLPDGCARNMCLMFGTAGGKLSLVVDGKQIGSVASKPLAEAFTGVYCDANAVCTLKKVEV